MRRSTAGPFEMCGAANVETPWEHFPHDADMGVRGYGATKAEAFAQAAVALTAVIVDPGAVNAESAVRIECTAPDDELLLADWLNAIVYEMATRRMLFSVFEVSIDGETLRATVYGEPVDRDRHQPAVEIKGATYTCLRVGRDDASGRWVAECVVDV